MGFMIWQLARTPFADIRGGRDSIRSSSSSSSSSSADVINVCQLDHKHINQLIFQCQRECKEFGKESATVLATQLTLLRVLQSHLNVCTSVLQPASLQHIPDGERWSQHLGKEYIELTAKIRQLRSLLREKQHILDSNNNSTVNTNTSQPSIKRKNRFSSFFKRSSSCAANSNNCKDIDKNIKRAWKSLYNSIERHINDEKYITLDWLSRMCERDELIILGRQYLQSKADDRRLMDSNELSLNHLDNSTKSTPTLVRGLSAQSELSETR